jgi:putative transposase
MRLRKQGHCAYRCDYHLVLTSKYRRKIFNAGSYAYLQELITSFHEILPEVEVLEINHDVDHVHMLLSIPPKMRVSDVVRTLKSHTGRHMKKRFEYMRKAYWGADGIWSDGYFVSTVGVHEDVIKRYIEKQGKEDTGQAKLEL